jgi:SAM-dependent methyltransferase
MTYQSKHTKIYDAKTWYDKVWDQYRNYHDHLNSFDKWYFLNLLPKDTSNLDIIDLWAWDGRLYKLFESRWYKFNSYTAIDISPKLLKNHPDQVNKIIWNLEDDLTFENESFDFAFSFFVFEHLSDLNNLFSETERILRTWWQFIIWHFIQRREFLRKSDPNKNWVQS